jgi:hypothetical protein
MLGLARWTDKGGSYRTLQRFYQTALPWLPLQWALLTAVLVHPDGEYVLAGDEVVVSKAGHHTYGLGRFFSSVAQRVIPSVSFLTLSILDVAATCSYPLLVQQLLPPSAAGAAPSPVVKRPRGRPKGSHNHVKSPPTLSPLLQMLQQGLRRVSMYLVWLKIQHVVLDGKFGNAPTAWLLRQQGLHLISKLRHDAALYLPYTGTPPARGPTKRYGDKLAYQQLPTTARVSCTSEGTLCTELYQLTVYHRDYAEALNVVVIVKTHQQQRAHVVLFSTDLTLTAERLVRYYRLRFQIEFNFRDAKQHWGLDDFMNVTEQGVTNAVNLAFFMVNVSQVLLKPYRLSEPQFSVLDLKARCRAQRYLDETLKMLPQKPTPDLIVRIQRRLARFSSIRADPADATAA